MPLIWDQSSAEDHHPLMILMILLMVFWGL